VAKPGEAVIDARKSEASEMACCQFPRRVDGSGGCDPVEQLKNARVGHGTYLFTTMRAAAEETFCPAIPMPRFAVLRSDDRIVETFGNYKAQDAR
jgi:hypothetical protein